MRKTVLLLCCISVLSLAGCNTQKDITEYNIANVETNLTKEEEHLKIIIEVMITKEDNRYENI